MKSTHFIMILLILPIYSWGEDEKVETLLEETDEFSLELEEDFSSTESIVLESTPDSEPEWVNWLSLAFGGGYTDNVYRGANKLSSGYSIIEGDLLSSYLPEADWIGQFYAYVQWKGYERPETINDEWIMLAQLSFEYYIQKWILGIELNDFYGDQFFDATDSEFDLPEGSRIITHQPSAALHATYLINKTHQLNVSVKGARSELSEAEYNQWIFGGALEWEATWTPVLKTKIEFSGEEKYSDSRRRKNERGTILSNSDQVALVKRVEEINTSIEWKLGTRFDFELTLSGGYRNLGENGGKYESYEEYYGEIQFEGTLGKTDFEISGEVSNRSYDERRWDKVMPGLLSQKENLVNIELNRPIGWGLDGRLLLTWERLRSQIERDNFRATSIELFIIKYF